jgi:apolipoprotein N-acyltransferase
VAASRLQAISEGRDLVQAAPTGFSAIVDHRGRVVARSALGARQVLVADLHLRTGATLYERFGDLPILLGAGLLVLGGWLAAFWAPATSEAARRRRRIVRGPGFRPGPLLRNR